MNLSRAQKKAKTAEEVENTFGRIVLVIGDDKFGESILFIDWAIKNQSEFIKGWGERIDKNKPHLCHRAAVKFLDLCEEYNNDNPKIYLFCKEVYRVCFLEESKNKGEIEK